MAVDKKTVNKSEKKNTSSSAKDGNFFKKVGAWFKKAGLAIAQFAKKVGIAVANFFKKLWAKVKTVQWGAPVKPVIAWSVIGGVLLVAVVIALLVWL